MVFFLDLETSGLDVLHDEVLAHDRDAAVAAGAIEWYSWRETTLTATGWERLAQGAREEHFGSSNLAPEWLVLVPRHATLFDSGFWL